MDNSRSYAIVLKCLRENWPQPVALEKIVAHYIEKSDTIFSTGLLERNIEQDILTILNDLGKLSLVTIETASPNNAVKGAKLSNYFVHLQRALKFSLSEIESRGRGVRINPVFPAPRPKKLDVFVGMPFHVEMIDVWDAIRTSCGQIGLSVVRADEDISLSAVVHDIWSNIYNARIIIVDCTNQNANVFYELGIAHTLGKKVVLISRKEADIPFDVRHLRVIIYGSDTNLLRRELEKTLARIKEVDV